MEVPHRVLCTQVITLGKEIHDLTVTVFSPAKWRQCQGLKGHHGASRKMARHSFVLPSETLANRVVMSTGRTWPQWTRGCRCWKKSESGFC